MCGGTDLLKDDGLFVCQSCGTKYSAAEAKKMMIEGVVEVSGTVKVDNSPQVENFVKLADSAFSVNNNKEAENYGNRILEINFEHYKAWLIKGKAAGRQSTFENNRFRESIEYFRKAVENAPETKIEDVKKEVEAEVSKLPQITLFSYYNRFIDDPSKDNANSIIETAISVKQSAMILSKNCNVTLAEYEKKTAASIQSTVMTAWEMTIVPEYQGAKDVKKYPSKEEAKVFNNRCFACVDVLKWSMTLSGKDETADIQRYKNLIEITRGMVQSTFWVKDFKYDDTPYWKSVFFFTAQERKAGITDIMEYHQKIKELDPTHVIPVRPRQGCYVATSVYGSYDCPQVWTLRRYRDNTLSKTWYGRIFVRIYYAVSPTAVKMFGGTNWFNRFWRDILDMFIDKLNASGVENTPYND